MIHFILSYPTWFLILCPLAGALYSAALYFRQKQVPDLALKKIWNYALMALRFLSVSLLCFLLLNPFVKRNSSTTEKPRVLILQDNSQSIHQQLFGADSLKYFSQLNDLKASLAKDYEVQSLSFGDALHEDDQINMQDKTTAISEVLEEVYDRNFNSNLGAIILASDGIFNRGINPIYTKAAESFPFYTIALGDTTPRRDIKIAAVYNNQIAYLNDKFVVKADVSGFGMSGRTANLEIEQVLGKGAVKKIATHAFTIDKADYLGSAEFTIDASSPGLQHYRLGLEHLKDEFTYDNNVRDIFIEVLDGRQKILICADAPHPDVSAMKQAIESNKNYQVDVKYANDNIENVTQYNLAILHQLPSRTNKTVKLLQSLKDKHISSMYVIGQNSAVSDLNALQPVLQIDKGKGTDNEVQASFNKDFGIFTLSDASTSIMSKYPPLIAPYGEYKSAGQVNTILYQKIGSVVSSYPLLSLGQAQDQRIGVLAGEGIWRWRLFDYQQNKSFDAFDEFFNKVVQNLSVKADKRKFRVDAQKHIFSENEQIIFDAQLYNDNYEMVNDPDVKISLTNEEGKEYTFVFSKSGKAYTLNAGFLPSGTYSYVATTSFNNKALTESGKISIKAIQLEAMETSADHQMLYKLASMHGGAMVYPKQLESLKQLLADRKDLKPIIYEQSKTDPIINWKLIFFLLIALLAAEWLLRKWMGGY